VDIGELNKLNGAFVRRAMDTTVCCCKVPVESVERIQDDPLTEDDVILGNWVVVYFPPETNPYFNQDVLFPKDAIRAAELFLRLREVYFSKVRDYYKGKMLQRDRIQLRPSYEGMLFLQRLYGAWVQGDQYCLMFPQESDRLLTEGEIVNAAVERQEKAWPRWTTNIPMNRDKTVDLVELELETLKLERLAEYERSKGKLESKRNDFEGK
jgi:hypothetical protein